MLCRSHTSEHKALPALDCQGLEQQLVHMLGSGTKKGSLKQTGFFFSVLVRMILKIRVVPLLVIPKPSQELGKGQIIFHINSDTVSWLFFNWFAIVVMIWKRRFNTTISVLAPAKLGCGLAPAIFYSYCCSLTIVRYWFCSRMPLMKCNY